MLFINRFFSYLILLFAYSVPLMVCAMANLLPKRKYKPTKRRIAVLGTFFNVGWFRSHIIPLTESGIDEVLLITDCMVESYPRVRYVCPPTWLMRLVGRAAAKGFCLIAIGLRYQPDLYMGYHIFPGAITALVVGRLFKRPVCYQMTGGPIEVIGGGCYNENSLMKKLRYPSKLLEKLALSVVRRFDLVVIRGKRAKSYLIDNKVTTQLAIIPGSVKINAMLWRTYQDRQYDMIFVGRLTEIKQPLQYVEIVAKVAKIKKRVQALLVGDGPMMTDVVNYAAKLEVTDRITVLGKKNFVEPFLEDSRIFVMPSRSEGLSIAMAEAMAAGAVPIVADVGELGDLVINEKNGRLIPPNDVEQYAQQIVALLEDPNLWTSFSQAGRESVNHYNSIESVAKRWQEELKRITEGSSSSNCHCSGD